MVGIVIEVPHLQLEQRDILQREEAPNLVSLVPPRKRERGPCRLSNMVVLRATDNGAARNGKEDPHHLADGTVAHLRHTINTDGRVRLKRLFVDQGGHLI